MLPNLCPPSCHSLPAGPRSGGRFETSFDRVPGSRCAVQGFQYGVCEVEIRRHVRKQARFHETRVSDCVQVLRPCHRASTHSKGTILLRCVVLDFVVACQVFPSNTNELSTACESCITILTYTVIPTAYNKIQHHTSQ